MFELDANVSLVTLQLSFSKLNLVPPSIRRLKNETEEECTKRKSMSPGIKVIEPTAGCSLAQFVPELRSAGFVMVDVAYKERIDSKGTRGGKTNFMVRFVFARHEFSEVCDEFVKRREHFMSVLLNFCKSSLWRVRAFNNPYYKNSEEVIGQRAISINLEVRQPLIHNGKPAVKWQTDPYGERIGKTPVPVKAERYLRITDNTVKLEIYA